MAREFDSPWKDALDLFLERVLAFFFPDLHARIDWSKGYENLGAELSEIVRQAELGPTTADKLFRVCLIDGAKAYLLIHIEVQAQPDTNFPKRMFTYYYRIIDRYNQEVVSLAILGDDQAKWRPREYRRSGSGCELRFRFRVVKLLDWVGREQELLDNPSPIGLIILAHLYSLSTQHQPERRKAAKWQLIRQLYERGWTPEGIRQVYRLVDWFLELPKELDEQLKNDLHAYEEERCMPYVTSIERLALEEGEKKGRKEGEKKGRKEGEKKGRKEGEKKGRKEGRKKGREEGRQEGRAAILGLIQPVLESKFGKRGSAFAKDLRAVLDLDKIREISHEILSGSKKIDELRAMLP